MYSCFSKKKKKNCPPKKDIIYLIKVLKIDNTKKDIVALV